MEKEIEKLKKIYLQTQSPNELSEGGFEDVIARIEKSNKRLYFPSIFVVVVGFVLVLSFAGLIYASKPNSILYPVRSVAQNAISKVAQSTPYNIRKSVDQFIEPKKITPTPKPTVSVPVKKTNPQNLTPTPKENDVEKKDKDKEEVKGESTINTNEVKPQENQSQNHGNSEDHSSQGQNQREESHASEHSSQSESNSNNKGSNED